MWSGPDAEAAAAQPVDALHHAAGWSRCPSICAPSSPGSAPGPARAARRRRSGSTVSPGRQHRRHQRVLGGGHRRLVEEDLGAAQARSGASGSCGSPSTSAPRRAEGQQVGVHAPAADEVAARQRQVHLAAAGEQRPGQQQRGPQAAAEVGVELGRAHPVGAQRERVRARRRARSRPRSSRSASITCTSRMSGTFSSTTSSSVSRQAARIGRAAFLLPLGTMVPDSARPPWMTSLS